MDKYLMTEKEAKQKLKENNNKLVDSSLESFVSLQNVNKVYPNGVHAVYDFNLEINKHDFIALVGPSGCGKSTTLRMIAGLEEISSGSLYIDKVYSNYLQSKDRNIAMVFQSYALYPQKTVYENIAFGLKIRHLPKEEIEERVFKASEILDLGDYLDRKPKELSGGQMQRVALGRAIVRQADLFLMDEPLSNLDAKLRVQMRSEIIRIHREVGATTIYVTHDQTEAMTMANVIVVMNKGFIQQAGRAMDVYNHPNNLFVATFIGSPAMNIIGAKYENESISLNNGQKLKLRDGFDKVYASFIDSRKAQLKANIDDFDNLTDEIIESMKASQIYKKEEKKAPETKKKKFALFNKNKQNTANDKLSKRESLLEELKALTVHYDSIAKGGNVKVGIRPEHIYLADYCDAPNKSERISAEVVLVERLGNESILHFNIFDTDFQVKTSRGEGVEIGDKVDLVFDLDKIHVFDVESGLAIK
jgi:ABC-type sugar transport system ATPase subunit